MISKINKLITFIIVAGLAVYVVVLNRESVTVFYSRSGFFSASSGLVLLLTFLSGIVLTAMVAFWFGFIGYLKQRRLVVQDKEREWFFEQVVSARAAISAGEFSRAIAQLENLVKRKATHSGALIAKLELARALRKAGETTDALKVLDLARAIDGKNIEVLFQASAANYALGDKTSALDNLSLILAQAPNKTAARFARDLCTELNRFDEAIEYQRLFDTLGGYQEQNEQGTGSTDALRSIEFRRLQRDAQGNSSQERDLLKTFTKKYSNWTPGLLRLASIEEQLQQYEAAGGTYIKAAKASGTARVWGEAVEYYLRQQQPEKAIAAARSAGKETEGLERMRAELLLAKTLIAVSMLDEARKTLSEFEPKILGSLDLPRGEIIWFLSLKSVVAMRLGNYPEATATVKEIADLATQITPDRTSLLGAPAILGSVTPSLLDSSNNSQYRAATLGDGTSAKAPLLEQ